jgi:hypothetical protein
MLIPERLTFWESGNRKIELWFTPQRGAAWRLYSYVDGVQISAEPMPSEIRGRIEFERKVESSIWR